MTSDRELLRAWSAGDREAGSGLFALHFDGIFRFFYARTRGIATVLEIPAGTVRSRIRRAIVCLREALVARAASPELLESTISDLDGWAKKLREELGRLIR